MNIRKDMLNLKSANLNIRQSFAGQRNVVGVLTPLLQVSNPIALICTVLELGAPLVFLKGRYINVQYE